MNQVVLGDEGVVGGVEGEEPVPVGVEAKQDGGGAQRACQARRPDRRPRGGRAHDSDVVEGDGGGRGGGDTGSEVPALVAGGVGGEVEHVAVAGVVDGQEEPEEAGPVALGADEEVGEAGQRVGAAADAGAGGGAGRGEPREAEAGRGGVGGDDEEEEGEEEGYGDEREEEDPPPPLARPGAAPSPGAPSHASQPHGRRRGGAGEGARSRTLWLCREVNGVAAAWIGSPSVGRRRRRWC